MLDCLLIFPPFVFPTGFYSKQRACDPPLSLMSLASYVRQYDYSVMILDCNTEFDETDAEFENYFVENFVNKYSTINVIGFNTTTPSINASFRVAEICKKYYPDCKMIFGGAHASFVPDECLDKEYIDLVCIGEGEDTLKEVLDGIPNGDIDGLAYKVNTDNEIQFVRSKARQRNKNLDDLPWPAYDLIDMSKYRPVLGSFKRLPATMMVTSRGCPWSCNFCRRPVGKMWTYRSAQSLFDEMKYLVEEFGVKDIAIQDDVFTVNEQRVYDLCDLIIESGIDLRWKCFARADIVSLKLLKRMNEAGCWGIMYGVENFDQKILDDMKKGIESHKNFEAVQWAKEANIEVRVCMMVGNVGDTEEIINNNIDLLIKMDPDFISVAIATPFPGHDLYNWASKRNLISTYDWDLYYGSTPILILDTLSPEDIIRLYRKMTFKFYFRPGFILKKALRMRSFTELWINFTAFLGLFYFMVEKVLHLFRPKKTVNNSRNKKVPLSPSEENKIKKLTETATKQTAIT